MTQTDTIIIGAGQSGLSLSYYLTQEGVEHLILDRGKVGENIRSQRWDSFHLITPNSMTTLPGFPYAGNNPDGFDSRDQFVKYLEDYAKSFNAPVKENVHVTSIIQNDNGYLVKTDTGDFQSKHVVVSTGSFHLPNIPEASNMLPTEIYQIHSSEYKNPDQLPEGAVLVVGAGNSGVQIAKDLNKAGRKVYLSLGRIRILPRSYRGKDCMWWMNDLGRLDVTVDSLPSPEAKNVIAPLLYGDGETVDLRKLAKDGVQLVGRVKEITKEKIVFEQNIEESLKQGDETLIGFKKMVDQFIADQKLDAPAEDPVPAEEVTIETMTKLNLNEVRSVIWATGFKNDYDWIKLPVFDDKGEPIHQRGVTNLPGFYFLGLRWLNKYKSFLIYGVGEDAKYLADHIKAN